MDVPAEFVEEAEEANNKLMPEKSRGRYEKELNAFNEWRKAKAVGTVLNETVMLAYVSSLSKSFKASSLWTKFSMLKKALIVNGDGDISRTPDQCPNVVSLLAESYNPHVRYGAAMALGIACAGTGLREAIAILEPIIQSDRVNFVRQGALIASAMICVQQSEQTCPKVNFFRQHYAEVIKDKHEDIMAKFGAILAQGIMDAGGRNTTMCLQSRTGHVNMLAVVGTLIFTQYWYWFPLSHCLSLAFTPTCLIGLNGDLNMPKMQFKSNSKPSIFAYPAPVEEKKREEMAKTSSALLSIAARRGRRDKYKLKMDVDDDKKAGTSCDKKAKEDKEKEKEREKEPDFEIINNPARVMQQQLKVLGLVDDGQYVPIKDVCTGGIIMVRNIKPEQEEIVELVAAHGPRMDDEKEPEAPEPFEWNEN